MKTTAARLTAINIDRKEDFVQFEPATRRTKHAPAVDLDELQDREEEAMLRRLVASKQQRGRLSHWN
jgi:hypothetical protein